MVDASLQLAASSREQPRAAMRSHEQLRAKDALPREITAIFDQRCGTSSRA
jgi:hypothetical protein